MAADAGEARADGGALNQRSAGRITDLIAPDILSVRMVVGLVQSFACGYCGCRVREVCVQRSDCDCDCDLQKCMLLGIGPYIVPMGGYASLLPGGCGRGGP